MTNPVTAAWLTGSSQSLTGEELTALFRWVKAGRDTAWDRTPEQYAMIIDASRVMDDIHAANSGR